MTKNKNEDVRYVDMSVEQLEQEITEERAFAKRQGVRDYQIKDVEKQKEIIYRQNEKIAEIKAEYEERIKIFKDRKKEANKRIKATTKNIESDRTFQKHLFAKVEILERIQKNLKKDPDFYKKVEDN